MTFNMESIINDFQNLKLKKKIIEFLFHKWPHVYIYIYIYINNEYMAM